MKVIYVILVFLFFIKISETNNSTLKLICSSNINCGYPNGQCLLNQCICSKGWIITDQSGCTYQLKSKLIAFLLSFFVGIFGVDWFYLSLGNAAYIIAGIIKLITFGGFGIWWIIDWIRILANAFQDGNGFYLQDWNN
jgi:TM2 domain-containing membrane protein YozV